jgi:hypothetical protein
MNELNFGVRLDATRFRKLAKHIEDKRLSKRAWMELTIDELSEKNQIAERRKK